MLVAPHHAAPSCPSCGDAGPLVPFAASADPIEAANVAHVRCAACGTDRLLDAANPDDLRTLARVWWSSGAWEGVQWAERNRGPLPAAPTEKT